MTDYIEEMMKTAGVDTHPRGCTNEDVNEYTDYYSNDCEGDCIDCTWYDPDEYYPDFTATKQLEIIKLLASKQGYVGMGELLDWYSEIDGLNLTQALAQLTTNLMNAGNLDKEKVKEILES